MSSAGWTYTNLMPYFDGTATPVVPTIGARTDGVSLLYPGGVHWLSGEPEAGKSWLAMSLCVQVIAEGGSVLYLDYEGSPRTAVARLKALGVDKQTGFAYFQTSETVLSLLRIATSLQAFCSRGQAPFRRASQ